LAGTNSTQSRSTGVNGARAPQGSGRAATGAGYGAGNLFGALLGMIRPPKANPFQESGRGGTPVWGGYVENIEKDKRLSYQNRYRTASDILANVSIVSAGLRYFLNLASVPAWSVQPADDLGDGKSSDQAKKLAEFAQDVIDDLDTSWSRIVRRSGMFRFHGFGIQEWVAIRREDGLIGMADLEQRPQHTIERWELADDGTIVGMWQRWPQNGQLLFLPRDKVVYMVDDTFTDSPEGLGLFRHLVEPGERIRRYLKMEGLGYERDMRGLPVGRAPLAEINALVEEGALDRKDADKMIAGMERFIQLQVKEEDSAILLDSAPYVGPTTDGYQVSPVEKWKVELLNNGATGFADISKAIDRLTHDMARILGVESLLIGGSGQGGSRALSEDKSRNLYLGVNATVNDIKEAMRRDFIGAVWKLNGLPAKLMPKLDTEDVAFKDVAVVAKALADMATAGAILPPDDPAINDVRDLLGVSKMPDGFGQAAIEASLLPRATPPKSGALAPPSDDGGTPPADKPPQGGGAGPRKPGPSPAAPGVPGSGQRNRTSNSTPD